MRKIAELKATHPMAVVLPQWYVLPPPLTSGSHSSRYVMRSNSPASILGSVWQNSLATRPSGGMFGASPVLMGLPKTALGREKPGQPHSNLIGFAGVRHSRFRGNPGRLVVRQLSGSKLYGFPPRIKYGVTFFRGNDGISGMTVYEVP